MPWPSDLTTVFLEGKYENFDSTPAAGRVVITPSTSVVDTLNKIRLLPTTFIAVLDLTGSFSIEIPATDDPDVTNTPFTYTISEQLVGYTPNVYSIVVPQSTPVSGDGKRHLSLVLLGPSVPANTTSQYLLKAVADTLYDPIGQADAAVATLQAQLNNAFPTQWSIIENYVAATHRSYGGQEFVAAQNVPTGISPTPIGDGSIADRAILLAGRCGYAKNTVGGDQFPTIIVNNTATSGAGSLTQAIVDSKAAGGGYIVWDPAGGASGVYTHAYQAGQALLVPSNTTLNGWAATVNFTGFGQDDNTSFNIGGISSSDFTNYYGGTPAHDVIVTGVNFNSNNGVADSHGDVVSVRFWARNVWFDHCFMTNPQKLTDGLFDITHCDSATVTWCDFYKHHKATLTHSKPIVSSPTGNQLPPGVTSSAPGPYTIQNVGGVDYIQNRVSYIHCLWDSNAQRNPLTDFDTTYVDVAGCWIRMFGGYNDGTNPTVNGLYDWPTVQGTRFSETTLPGPSLGPDGNGTSVPGAYRRNSGGGSKSDGSNVSQVGSHLLVRGTVFTNLPGDTNQAVTGSNGNYRTSGNVYENVPYTGDVHPERVSDPYYTLKLMNTGDIKTALQYGAATRSKGFWSYVGPSTLGTAGTVIQQNGSSVGAAKFVNFTGPGFDTITYNSGTGLVTVPALLGAADPSNFLKYGTHAGRPSAGSGNVNQYYMETDTGIIFQCRGTGPYSWVQLTNAYPTPVIPGQEIGYISYHPTTQNTNASTTSTSLVDFAGLAVTAAWNSNSASMFDVVFVAPPSGSVNVVMSTLQSLSAGQAIDWALYDVTAVALVANSEIQVTNSASQIRGHYEKRFTGLTAGTTYTWRWQLRVQVSATLTLSSGGNKGPVRMQVFAA